MRRRRQRGLTLIETIVAATILVITLLGVVATFAVVQSSQSASKERLAATLAAASKLDEIASWASLNDFADLTTTWDDTGFNVVKDPQEIGAVAATSTSTMFLDPAPDADFPGDRAAAPAAVKAMAGFVDATDVAGRDDLVEVTITVAWRSKVGNGTESITLRQWVADQ